ncbi:MAG: tRNA 2-thiouridine(34) synthase MnmA [Solirubrobacteraceae bacterium]
MSVEALSHHLEAPLGRGHLPKGACTGAAGGAACGDVIRVSLAVDPQSPDGVIEDAGFDASGCGAVIAAGSAAVSLVRGASLLDAARVGAPQIAHELGGLLASKLHAAELACDALHRALGWAARRHARLAPAPRRTLVAMSGGVDSAVAALLVREQVACGTREHGEDAVVAVTLELWSDAENDPEGSCCSAHAVRTARELAHGMGFAHLSIDLREEFAAGVVTPWIDDHRAGLTPNPCVRCNGKVRLDGMLALADRLGAGTLATGHYARVRRDDRHEQPLLEVALDESKDQSYALAALSPTSLARMSFPLGSLTKAQVRERAAEAGLAVARRPDSQDLCFLAGTRHAAFLERHGGIQPRPGAILDLQGRELGEHAGVHTVTVGQRRGLGLSGGDPLFVIGTDPAANTVTVGPRERLLCERVNVREVTLHRPGASVDSVKVRYRGRRLPCRLEGAPGAGTHETVQVRFSSACERTAPGQVACLYSGDALVGHGTIDGSL